jgi:methylated-DNA-protein-cysteine methyltransferase-like protein
MIAVVRCVPAGRVTTYGDVSRALYGHSGAARTVGWALHALSPAEAEVVPWWRVVNARGRISTSCMEHDAGLQRAILESEGVTFGPDDRIDLERFGWDWQAAGDD